LKSIRMYARQCTYGIPLQDQGWQKYQVRLHQRHRH